MGSLAWLTDVPDAPIAPVELRITVECGCVATLLMCAFLQVSGTATISSLTVSWPRTAGNAYAVDYFVLRYIDTEATSPAWTTVQCDNLGDGNIADWFVFLSSFLEIPLFPHACSSTA